MQIVGIFFTVLMGEICTDDHSGPNEIRPTFQNIRPKTVTRCARYIGKGILHCFEKMMQISLGPPKIGHPYKFPF